MIPLPTSSPWRASNLISWKYVKPELLGLCYVLTLDIARDHAPTFAVKKKEADGHGGTIYMLPVLAEALADRPGYGNGTRREGVHGDLASRWCCLGMSRNRKYTAGRTTKISGWSFTDLFCKYWIREGCTGGAIYFYLFISKYSLLKKVYWQIYWASIYSLYVNMEYWASTHNGMLTNMD